MIWTACRAAIFWLLKLFIPAPDQLAKVINPNAPCLACGAEDGEIRTIVSAPGSALVRHTCHVCLGIWFEEPLLEKSRLTAKAE